MDNSAKQLRDPETHRLFGTYCQESGIFEIKKKDRIMRICFPPGTTLEFIFC